MKINWLNKLWGMMRYLWILLFFFFSICFWKRKYYFYGIKYSHAYLSWECWNNIRISRIMVPTTFACSLRIYTKFRLLSKIMPDFYLDKSIWNLWMLSLPWIYLIYNLSIIQLIQDQKSELPKKKKTIFLQRNGDVSGWPKQECT